ncbi:MAG: hypothetical protein AAGG81_02445 [Chlamydiota bacterium]
MIDAISPKVPTKLCLVELTTWGYRKWRRLVHQPSNSLLFVSCNIGSKNAVKVYRGTIKSPLPVDCLEKIGKDHDVLITRNITLNPMMNGCCVGMSMELLSRISQHEILNKGELKKISSFFLKGASCNAVALQNLYHHFLVPSAKADKRLVNLSSNIITDSNCEIPEDIFLKIVLKHRKERSTPRNFRQYAIQELQKLNISIDEELYTTIIEVEKIYSKQFEEDYQPYEQLLIDAKTAVAKMVGIDLKVYAQWIGRRSEVLYAMLSLEKGCFLLAFPSHVVVWIVSFNSIAYYFDPCEGLFMIDKSLAKKRLLLKRLLASWLNESRRENITLFLASNLLTEA